MLQVIIRHWRYIYADVSAVDDYAWYYHIVNRMNGLVMDVADESTAPGAHVIMSNKVTGKDGQLWYDRSGKIVNKLNRLCLEDKGKLHVVPKN